MIQRINIYVYPPLFKQASADLSAKQFSKAQLQFKKCLQVNPSSYSSYLNLAYIAHIKKDYKKAETLCDIAINIRPYCGEAYYNRCLAMIAQGISKFQSAIRDINSAYSCYYLESFKCSGQFQALQEAVKYSQNNFQALRLLVTLSKTNKKQYYKNLLHQHEEWYRVSGSINANKSIASAPEQGLYRLNGKTQNLTIQTIKRKISQYNLLIKSRKSQQATKQKQKKRLQSGIYQLTIQPQTNIIKQFSQNSQSQRQSQQYNINVLSSFDCDSIQLKRYSTNIQDSSRQISSYHLNIPLSNENLNRYSLAQITRSPMVLSRVSNANRNTDNSFKQNHNKLQNSFRRVNGSLKCDNSMTSSRFCLHHGCTKCTKQNKDIPSGPPNGIKMQIKTLQIFRNQSIVNPKPYIIVYDGQKSHITEVDQQGGHFPSWNRVFYLKKDSEQPYRIELWHKGYKQKQDFLIGTATFQNKQGRFKSYFIKKHGGIRKTGYIFIQMGK